MTVHKTLLLGQPPTMPNVPPGLPLDGLVAWYGFEESRNLLRYSQQFDNAAWTKTDCAIAANDAAAPDRTTTADKVTLTVGAAQSCAQTVAVAAGAAYTFSGWVKLGTAADLKYAIYNVSGSADIIAPTAYGATGEWARYSATFTTPVGCTSISVRPVKDSAQDNGETAWIWGAQVNPGPVPTAYYPTGDKQTVMDWSRPRRNLLLPNQANGGSDGTITGFSKNVNLETITSDAAEHWQGSRCIKVVTTADSQYQGFDTPIQTKVLPSKPYTYSVYVKGSGTVKLFVQGYKDNGATPTTSLFGDSVTLTGDWTRYSLTYTGNADTRLVNVKVITVPAQAITFWVDGLQLEEGSIATAWQAPPNIGILGSAIGSDTNDPTWVKEGLSYGADDYTKLGPIADRNGIVQPMGSMLMAFYVPTPISAASAKSCSFALAPNAAIYLGAVAGAPANCILTVQYAAGSFTSWCHASDTIAAGWHTLDVVWNGGAYDLVLDGALLPATSAGSPALLSPTNANCCYDGTTFGPGIARAARALYSRALAAGERAQAHAALKTWCKTERGVILP